MHHKNNPPSLKLRRTRGFTLIELLVVISIIGLLASVVLVALNGARQKSRDSKRVADIANLGKTLELYFNDASAYPTGTGYVGVAPGALFGSSQLATTNPRGTIFLTPTYLLAIPSAPTPPDLGCVALGTNAYNYQVANDGSTFTFTFCIGGSAGSLAAGTHYLTPKGWGP